MIYYTIIIGILKMQERINYEFRNNLNRDDRLEFKVARYNSIIDEINNWIAVAFQYGGRIYGSYLFNIIIPKMSNLDCESYFKLTNIWFRNYHRKITIWFQRKSDAQIYFDFIERSKCDSYIVELIRLIISPEHPTHNYDINRLTFNGKFESYCSKSPKILFKSIKNRTCEILPEYAEALYSETRQMTEYEKNQMTKYPSSSYFNGEYIPGNRFYHLDVAKMQIEEEWKIKVPSCKKYLPQLYHYYCFKLFVDKNFIKHTPENINMHIKSTPIKRKLPSNYDNSNNNKLFAISQ